MIITQNNLSKELLINILHSVFIETEMDRDGDIMIPDAAAPCFVVPYIAGNESRIRFAIYYAYGHDVSEQKRIETINDLNKTSSLLKATNTVKGRLSLSWDIPVAGGITKKAFICALAIFSRYAADAIEKHLTGDVRLMTCKPIYPGAVEHSRKNAPREM